jgi:hypothetical protein
MGQWVMIIAGWYYSSGKILPINTSKYRRMRAEIDEKLFHPKQKL